MIINTTRRRKSLGFGKSSLVFGDERLEVNMHRRCLNGLNNMELGNDVGMTFFEDIFHSMVIHDLRGTNYDSLELVLLACLLELHG
jgi:hypothetical protein